MLREGNSEKAGIVTLYHGNYNFGGLLQAYALPAALEGSTCHRWVESTIECLAEQWKHQCGWIRSLAENAEPAFYALLAYGNYMWAIYQLSESFCPLSFREKRRALARLKEIMNFDTYRGLYPFEMEHGLIYVKYRLVRYHLEWLILLFRPLFVKMVKRGKNVTRRKQ